MLSVAAGYDYVRGAAFVIQAAGLQGSARTVAEWTTSDLVESEIEVPARGGSAARARLSPGEHERAGDAAGARRPRRRHRRAAADPVRPRRRLDGADRRHRGTARPEAVQHHAAHDRHDRGRRRCGCRSEAATRPIGRVGMMGISFAGGLSIVAASRPSLRDRVAFVMSFGGHGDLPRTLRYLCTGVQPDGVVRPPHDYGIAIILLGVADRVVPRSRCSRCATRSSRSCTPRTSTCRQGTGAGRVRTRARLAASAGGTGADADELRQRARRRTPRPDPAAARRRSSVTTRRCPRATSPTPPFPVYLLHGTDDNVIPAVESVLLAETLRARGVEVEQLATPLITHAEVDRSAAARRDLGPRGVLGRPAWTRTDTPVSGAWGQCGWGLGRACAWHGLEAPALLDALSAAISSVVSDRGTRRAGCGRR